MSASDQPLYRSSSEYPRITLTIGVVAAVVAIIFFVLDIKVGAILATVAVVACAFAWLMCLWYAVAWNRRLAKLQQGEFHAHWLIEKKNWHDHLLARKKKTHLVLVLMPLISIVPPIGVSAAMYEAGHYILGSPLLTFVIPPLITVAIAAAITGYIYWTIVARAERLRDMQGECYLGYKGVYITGLYWPYVSMGFGLVAASCDFKYREVGELVLTFRNQHKYGHVDNDLRIPVPLANRSEVEGFVKMFAGEE